MATSEARPIGEAFIRSQLRQYGQWDTRVGQSLNDINAGLKRFVFGPSFEVGLVGRFSSSAGRIRAMRTMEADLEMEAVSRKSIERLKTWNNLRDKAKTKGFVIKTFEEHVDSKPNN